MRHIERQFSIMGRYLMRNVVFLGLIVTMFLSANGFTSAQPPRRPGENLAAGKSYQLSPRPNYKHCTDPEDNVQLTDGVYTEGHFWTKKETVGWSNANPAVVTIDLGSVAPIRGVSFNTAAGIAGVTWPMSILLLVSDDGATYHLAGDLVELDRENGTPETEGYSKHCFWTDELQTHGRFVQVMIVPSGPYTFVDEIEVFRGPDQLLDKPLTGRRITDSQRFFDALCMTQGIRRRVRNDIDAVRSMLESVADKAGWLQELKAIEAEVGSLKAAPEADFRTVFPINDLHRRVFAVQAATWRAQGVKPVTAWQRPKWDMVDPFEKPEGDASVDVEMMSGEFRSGAFLLSHAGEETVSLRLSVNGMPGGANPGYVAVHEGVFTDTKQGVPVLAALPLAERDESGYVFTLDPGTTRQVWLTFNPQEGVPAGEHRGTIDIQPAGIRVPLRLKIHPLSFPDQPTLHLGGWDYTDRDAAYDLTPDTRPQLIRHLRRHFVDTPWAQRSVLPLGKYDDDGNLVEVPDTANFEKWIERWPDARNYYVFMAFRDTFARFKMGTPPFKNAVANWITWWVDKLRTWDIEPEQLGLLLVDEPYNDEKSRTIIEYAKVIQAAQPRVVVWEDPTWRQPWKAPPELFTLSDTLCPNLPMWIAGGKRFADFYVAQREAGRTLWFYSCSGPGKLLDPYAYHRMQHWFCWKYDAKGSGFWAFGDSNGASSWNEYLTRRGAYTPVFLDDHSVTPGKHMEAIREGMEDYEYLRMLRDRVTELEQDGAEGELLDEARKLLTSAANRVTACMTDSPRIMWQASKDRSVADAVRLEILDVLTRLKGR